MPSLVLVLSCVLMRDGPPGPADEVRIVYWFDRARPLDTFRYQVYDLGRGAYTPAVDAWLRLLRRDYPAYAAYARDVDLARMKGDTRKHRIGAAIVREFLAIGSEQGYTFAGVPPGASSTLPLPQPGRAVTLPRISPVPNLQPPSFGPAPFPIPYPRPHP